MSEGSHQRTEKGASVGGSDSKVGQDDGHGTDVGLGASDIQCAPSTKGVSLTASQSNGKIGWIVAAVRPYICWYQKDLLPAQGCRKQFKSDQAICMVYKGHGLYVKLFLSYNCNINNRCITGNKRVISVDAEMDWSIPFIEIQSVQLPYIMSLLRMLTKLQIYYTLARFSVTIGQKTNST